MNTGRIAAIALAGTMLATSAAAESLKVATWNIENFRVGSRSATELTAMAQLVDILDADVIAMQEVDGPEAAEQIFDPNAYEFHFSSRPDAQRTGFAIRRGLTFTRNPDFEVLDVGGVRFGTDLTVMLDGQPLRLLSVHLKSFCHQDDLDDVSESDNTDCGKLKRQIPILESWIEARAQEGIPLIVLGDFNRRMNIAGDDVWADLDDGDPDLTKLTEGLTSACLNFRFPEYIDHIVTDTRGAALVRPGSFEQVLFTAVGGGDELSDHCPIAAVFETEAVTPSAGDPIADLLDRLDAVQVELQAIRDAVSDLRE